MALLHHVMTVEDWHRFRADGESRRSTRHRDLADEGFVHCSYAGQVEATVANYYADLSEVVIVTLDPDLLGAAVVDEPTDDGTLFPHVYGPLSLGAVVEVEHRSPG